MEIKLDEKAIAQLVSDHTTEAIGKAFGGWEMEQAVAALLSREVLSGVVTTAVKESVSQIDQEALAAALARELKKTVVKATVSILNEGVVDIICKLRGIGNYSSDDLKRRAEIKAELIDG